MEELSEILEIEVQSIESVASTMRDLRNYLENQRRTSMLPFLDAYLKITEEVIEEKNKGHFEKPEQLVELDIRFAELYFEAVEAYLEKGEKKQPWKTYFEYIEREDSKPVLELLLGINAHINADLTQVLEEQEYDNLKDFKRVDNILRKSLYPVMAKIGVERRDIELFGIIGLPLVTWTGLKRIQSWRSLSFKNSNKHDFDLLEVREQTEKNAENLIDLRHEYTPQGVLRKPFKVLKTGVKL